MKSVLLQTKRQVKRGFTLVEIAIVLVIIGLLIGGVLRGQELINTARVRSLIAEQTAIQTAYYGFLDRYKLLPGNLTNSQNALIGQNAVLAGATGFTVGTIPVTDSPAFFNNIAAAGFITCSQCVALGAVATGYPAAGYVPTPANSLVNNFAGVRTFTLQPATAGATADSATTLFLSTTATELANPMLVTGSNIQSDLLAEADRKMDDGTPSTGTFRFTNIRNGALAASAAVTTCVTAVAAATPAAWQVNPVASCQGASFF